MQNDISIQDINHLLHVVEQSIKWANTHEENSFPFSAFKEKRRELKKIKFALEEKCSAAAYGESQNGKSYLISSLLSTKVQRLPFPVVLGGSCLASSMISTRVVAILPRKNQLVSSLDSLFALTIHQQLMTK